MSKELELAPYREPKQLLYTLEIHCHKGQRFHSPVRRITGIWVDYRNNQQWTSIDARHDWNEPVARLHFPSIDLRQDGIWIYGMEYEKKQSHGYYQIWCLLPEPNEYSKETTQ